MTQVVLRPRSASEIIDVSLQILRRNYPALVTLSVAAMLPLAAVAAFTSARSLPGGAMAPNALDGLTVLISLASAVFYIVAQNAVMVGASQAYLGEPVRAGIALRRAAMRTLPLILLGFVLYIGVILGMILLIIPGIYLAIRWLPLPMVTVLEDGDPGQTLRRVWALSRDNAWHIFVLAIIIMCIYIGVAFIAIFLMSGSLAFGARATAAGSILYYAVLALFFPFFEMVFVALYYDLRVRHEGLDVEMMAQGLGDVAPEV